MTVFRVRGADHSNTWGFRRAHFCLSCCLTLSSAKMQSMARWERYHTDSRLRPKVEAASWYSWDKSVQKTPLSSVCNVIKRNISHATFFSFLFLHGNSHRFNVMRLNWSDDVFYGALMWIFVWHKEKQLTQITHGCPSWYQYLKWCLE